MRQGTGTFADGVESYEGGWRNDEMHGSGAYRAASGASYEVSRTASVPALIGPSEHTSRMKPLPRPTARACAASARRRGCLRGESTTATARTRGPTAPGTPAGGEEACETCRARQMLLRRPALLLRSQPRAASLPCPQPRPSPLFDTAQHARQRHVPVVRGRDVGRDVLPRPLRHGEGLCRRAGGVSGGRAPALAARRTGRGGATLAGGCAARAVRVSARGVESNKTHGCNPGLPASTRRQRSTNR